MVDNLARRIELISPGPLTSMQEAPARAAAQSVVALEETIKARCVRLEISCILEKHANKPESTDELVGAPRSAKAA